MYFAAPSAMKALIVERDHILLKPPHSPFHESFSSVSVAKRICAPEVCNIISLNEAHITHIGYFGAPTRPAVMHQCSSNAVLFYGFNHLCDSCL